MCCILLMFIDIQKRKYAHQSTDCNPGWAQTDLRTEIRDKLSLSKGRKAVTLWGPDLPMSPEGI